MIPRILKKTLECSTYVSIYSNRNVLSIIRNISTNNNPDFKSFSERYRDFFSPKSVVEPPYSHIAQIGDPVLRQKAKAVPNELITTKEIKFLVQRMKDCMRKYNCVGLAASQIGIPLQVILIEFNQKTKEKFSAEVFRTREMELIPLTILINPEVKVINFEKKTFAEACESVKGYSAEVPRFHEISVSAKDCDNKDIKLNLKGWNARIIQHEMDHLHGKMFTDIMNAETFMCTFWQAVNFREGRIKMPFSP